MRVLLTGASGLIGRQCIAPLREAGHRVVALSRSPCEADETIAANLLEPAQVDAAIAQAGADALLHLAWHDGADRWSSSANLDWAAATLRLVKSFGEAGGKRVVAVGSCAEYDWSQSTLSETTPLRPASLYGAAKASAAIALTGAAPALNLSLAWARVFFCYGPGEPKGRLLGDLIQGLAAGDRVPCTDGLQERDFLHTADIARALVAILDSGVTGAINLGSGTPTPVRSIIETVARQMGRPELIDLGARPRPEGDPARIIAAVDRLAAEVGFRPRISLEEGIASVIAAEAPK